jgi:hypothetical protein
MENKDVHAVEVTNLGGGEVRVTIVGALCEQECEERVRYWNDETGGNASCGCCIEGAESCATIQYPQVVRALLSVALADVDKARGN